MHDVFAHHAYCLVGDRDLCRLHLYGVFETHNINHIGNPDITELIFETVGVDDARAIIERQSSKAVEHEYKVFVVYAYTFTTEAQNALLKIIEEPAPSTQFVLVVPSLERLLPTVRSRIFVERVEGVHKEDVTKEFVSTTVAQRLKMAEKIAKSIKDEKESREVVYMLARGVEGVLSKDTATNRDALKEVLRIKQALLLKGVSVKQLLEQLALVL